MSFQQAMKMFDYPQAVNELGLSSESPHLWEELYHRSCGGSPDLQALHDLSWVLTQIDPQSRATLHQMARQVENSLKESYGPYIFECCQAVSHFSLEGVILPLAKLLNEEIDELQFFLLHLLSGQEFSPQQLQIPYEEFVVCFAQYVVQQLIQKLPSRSFPPETKGKRIPIGRDGNCGMCNGEGIDRARMNSALAQIREQARQAIRRGPPTKISPSQVAQLGQFLGGMNSCFVCQGTGLNFPALFQDPDALREVMSGNHIPDWVWEKYPCPECFGRQNWQAGLQTPLPTNPRKTVQDFLDFLRLAADKGTSPMELRDFLGEDVLCKQCTYWVLIPSEGQPGWVYPVVDIAGQNRGWIRIDFESQLSPLISAGGD